MNNEYKLHSTNFKILQGKDFFILLLIVFIASSANIFLKVGGLMFNIDPLVLQNDIILFLKENWMIIIGYIFYIIPTFLTIYLYKKYTVGYIQALTAAVYILTPVLAWVVGLEKLNLTTSIGIGIVVSGVTYISFVKEY